MLPDHARCTHPVPRNDAAQVGANSIHSEVLQVTRLSVDDQVSGVALRMRRSICQKLHPSSNQRSISADLEPLRQGVVALEMRLEPINGLDVVAEGILGSNAATTTARAAQICSEQSGSVDPGKKNGCGCHT